MTVEEGNGRLLKWRLDRLEERLEAIEAVNPKLLAYEIAQINKRLSLLVRVFVTIGISTVTGAILLAYTVVQNA